MRQLKMWLRPGSVAHNFRLLLHPLLSQHSRMFGLKQAVAQRSLPSIKPKSVPSWRPRATFGKDVISVLAVETSADDTCAAVVTSDRRILSNVVIRQDEL